MSRMVVAHTGHHTRQTVRTWRRRGDTTTVRTAPDPALITVKAALRLPQLRRGRPEVLAGGARLDNPIRWAHAGEVPDIATLLKGGELLLTTGMGIGHSAADQRTWITSLAKRGVAAVVLELGQAFREAPPALVQAADEECLPLIVLHRVIPFVEATEAIHSGIVGRQLAILRRGEETHRRFTELMLEGAGVPEVLAALASMIANPVLLERAGEGIVFHATHRAGGEEVLAAWEERGESGALVLPVPAGGRSTWGRLIALPLDSALNEYDRIAAERAVAVVALALLRRREEDLLGFRERGNFLAELAAGRLSPADAALRAEGLGFDARGRLLMAVAVTSRPGAAGVGSPAWAPVWTTVVDELRSRAVPALVGVRPEQADALVLIGLAARDRRLAVIGHVVDAANATAARQLGTPDAPVVAVGGALADWADVPPALRDVAEVAHLARHLPPRGWHDATAPDLDRLLWHLRDDRRVRAFVDRRLHALIDHDQRRRGPLLPTMEALLDHGGRKAETARALHLERQSLYHRIERIEQLLGASLDDPETRLGLHLAVRARRHMQTG